MLEIIRFFGGNLDICHYLAFATTFFNDSVSLVVANQSSGNFCHDATTCTFLYNGTFFSNNDILRLCKKNSSIIFIT